MAALILCGPASGVPSLAVASALPARRAVTRPAPPSCIAGGLADTVRARRSVKVPTVPNSAWGRDTLRAVRARHVCVGMNEEMVRSAWGLPPRVQVMVGPKGKVVKYSYPDYIVVLEHDRVTSITPARGV